MKEANKNKDANLRKSLSPIATRASRIVDRIRAREHHQVWANNHDGGPVHRSDEILYPGVMFHMAKNRMETTDLWKIVHRMPKGSLLHAHLDAMFDVDFLIDQAFSTRGMCMWAPRPLRERGDLDRAPFFFRFADPDARATRTEDTEDTVWSPGYTEGSLVDLHAAAASFPNGGTSGFKQWLRTRCVLMPEHSFYHYHGVDAIWDIFARTFPVVNSLLQYEPILRACLRRLLRQLAADGIRYVEFRTALVFEYRREGHDAPEEDDVEWFRLIQHEIERFQATDDGKRFHGARIIWTTLRGLSNRDITDSMKRCIATKKLFPQLIAGFDLVGQEDKGRPLVDLVPVLFWFRKRCVEEAVELPFFFHAGECLGDGTRTDHNLFDAILLGTRRIGHGFSLYKHPLLIDLVKDKRILVECCPISNELLRLTATIQTHPLPALLARAVPVSLCNDDPAILGHGRNGLTPDFWQAVQGLEALGLAGLAALVENSIRWSCYEDQSAREWGNGVREGMLGDGVKAQRLQEWYRDFEQFCEWILLEFAHEDVD